MKNFLIFSSFLIFLFCNSGTADWNSEIIDSGYDPAVTVEPEGQIHLCYTKNDVAMYATNRNGRWQTQAVSENARAWDIVYFEGIVHYCYASTNPFSGVTSLYYTRKAVDASNWESSELVVTSNNNVWAASMSVDPTGAVHILFMDCNGPATSGSMVYCKRVSNDWQVEGIGEAYDYAAVSADVQGFAHVIYYSLSMGGSMYLTNSPSGDWQHPELIEPVGGQLEGMECDIDTDKDNLPHVIYVADDREDYKYAKRTDSWEISLLEDGDVQSGGNAIAVDKDDAAHVAFFHLGSGTLKYKKIKNGFLSESNIARSGRYNDIAVDSTVSAHAVFEDDDGNIVYAKQPPSDISTTETIPNQFYLAPNFPNPFNSQTRITYSVGKPGLVELRIFDIQGKLIKTLVHQAKAAGQFDELWDGTNHLGLAVPSGVYYCVFKSETFEQSRKLVLIR